MSAVLLDDPVSLIGINYNVCILILNENGTKVNIPLKRCVQIVVHDVPYTLKHAQHNQTVEYMGWIGNQFGEIQFFFKFRGDGCSEYHDFAVLDDSKKYTPFPRNLEHTHGYHFMLGEGTGIQHSPHRPMSVSKAVGFVFGRSDFICIVLNVRWVQIELN